MRYLHFKNWKLSVNPTRSNLSASIPPLISICYKNHFKFYWFIVFILSSTNLIPYWRRVWWITVDWDVCLFPPFELNWLFFLYSSSDEIQNIGCQFLVNLKACWSFARISQLYKVNQDFKSSLEKILYPALRSSFKMNFTNLSLFFLHSLPSDFYSWEKK